MFELYKMGEFRIRKEKLCEFGKSALEYHLKCMHEKVKDFYIAPFGMNSVDSVCIYSVCIVWANANLDKKKLAFYHNER